MILKGTHLSWQFYEFAANFMLFMFAEIKIGCLLPCDWVMFLNNCYEFCTLFFQCQNIGL